LSASNAADKSFFFFRQMTSTCWHRVAPHNFHCHTAKRCWCENSKDRTLTLVYLHVTAHVYRAGLKSSPILNLAAPTTKPGDIPPTYSLVGDYWTDANEQRWPAQWGGKRNTV